MRELKFPETLSAKPIFRDIDDTGILSALEGSMGRVWADEAVPPGACHIELGDFHFFAGDEKSPDAAQMLKTVPAGGILILENPFWEMLAERTLAGSAERIKRYAFYKNPAHLNVKRLEKLARCPRGFSMARMDEALAEKALAEPWSRDFCSRFASARDFYERGLGVCVLSGDELVAGASSYSVYSGGIEIQVDTREDFRRLGLALAASASLILLCLSRGLYPSWDAANPASAGLAEKLGYRLRRAYDAYEIR